MMCDMDRAHVHRRKRIVLLHIGVHFKQVRSRFESPKNSRRRQSNRVVVQTSSNQGSSVPNITAYGAQALVNASEG
eukprot:7004762-Pyramimonas_sp.AAC.1